MNNTPAPAPQAAPYPTLHTTPALGGCSSAPALTRSDVERSLAADVNRLIFCTPDDGLLWLSSRTDLMEALHVATSTGLVVDSRGRCVTFRQAVGSVCTTLHVAPPSNPYETVRRAMRRKGMRCRTYTDRYRHMLAQQGINSHPLFREVGKIEN